MRKEKDDFDDIYQSLEEPVEATDDGENKEIMGTIAYGAVLPPSSNFINEIKSPI